MLGKLGCLETRYIAKDDTELILLPPRPNPGIMEYIITPSLHSF